MSVASRYLDSLLPAKEAYDLEMASAQKEYNARVAKALYLYDKVRYPAWSDYMALVGG